MKLNKQSRDYNGVGIMEWKVYGKLAKSDGIPTAVKVVIARIDAIGEVTVRITAEDGRVYTGRGADNDIVVSSAKAYVNAINRMIQTTRSKEGK